jgi:hypothetical protein
MLRLITLFLLQSVLTWGQTAVEKPITNSDWKILEDSIFTIQYPPNWELNQGKQMGTSFILLSPQESEKDFFRENINLLIQDLAGYNIDLDKYTDISVNQVKNLVTNSTLLESKRIKLGNDEYQKVIYTGDQGVFHLKFEQYFRVVKKKAYVLTFTTEQNKFDDFKEKGEYILNSFLLH